MRTYACVRCGHKWSRVIPTCGNCGCATFTPAAECEKHLRPLPCVPCAVEVVETIKRSKEIDELMNPAHTLNSDQTVAVATDYYWLPIDANTPRGVKLQLLGEGGVACYGEWNGKDTFWKKWAPLPKNKD